MVSVHDHPHLAEGVLCVAGVARVAKKFQLNSQYLFPIQTMIGTKRTKFPSIGGFFQFSLSTIFVSIIRLYQQLISPLFLPSCRFDPSCSEYALKAFKKFSVIRALYLILKRIAKCHPWGSSGADPLPR